MLQTATSAVEVGTSGLSRSGRMGTAAGDGRGDSSQAVAAALLRHAQLSQVALR